MLKINDLELKSRLLLGTGKFENEQIQAGAIKGFRDECTYLCCKTDELI